MAIPRNHEQTRLPRPFSGYAERDAVSPQPERQVEDGWPVHPIRAFRAPFDESIAEAMDPDVRIRRTLDAAARRLQLLELDNLPDDYSSRWRHKPGAKFHPLWKLVAQISFGIHLLQQRSAKSEEEVVRILQKHIDEVDGFLEDTHADFDLAIKDIDERARLLQLSLDHGRTFGRMLRNADFRADILHGNDIIDRIIRRTWRALKSSLGDVRKGIEATEEFSKYLDRVRREWTPDNHDMAGVYDAMRGNADGWYRCYKEIEIKAKTLKDHMGRLGALVGEVTRRAGIASRKVMRDAQPAAQAQRSSSPRPSRNYEPSKSGMASRKSLRKSMSKPLPPDPTRRSRLPSLEQPISANASPVSRHDSTAARSEAAPESLHEQSLSRYSTKPSRRPSQASTGTREAGQHDGSGRSVHRMSSQHSHGAASFGSAKSIKANRLTSDKLVEDLEKQDAEESFHSEKRQTKHSRLSSRHSRRAELESPYMVGHLQQRSQPDVNQWAKRVRDETQSDRPMTSPATATMEMTIVSNGGALALPLEALAGNQPLVSPAIDNMLILDDTPRNDYVHSEKFFVPGLSHERASSKHLSVHMTPDSEEKQVMSSETFLMLDNVDEAEEDVERYRQAYSLNNLVELDSTGPGSQSDGQALSRHGTQKSLKTGTRSRPHSSYSVIDAWRKSRGLSEADAQSCAGQQDERPDVPALPSIANLAVGASDRLGRPTQDQKRHSSDATAPLLTQSGSTASLNSLPIDEGTPGDLLTRNLPESEPQKSAPDPVAQSPRLSRQDLPKASTFNPRASLSRSVSAQPVLRTSPTSTATLRDTWKTSHLIRSNSTKSHLRLSTIVDAGAVEDIEPDRLVAAPTMLELLAQAPPHTPSPRPAATPQLSSAESEQQGTQPVQVPQRQESWFAEKFVIVPSPESEHGFEPKQGFDIERPSDSYTATETVEPVAPAPVREEPRVRTLGIRKPAPRPLVTSAPLVEADEGTPRLQRMITSFTPLSPRSPGLVSASSLRHRLVPQVPSSPSAVSSVSKEALPLFPEVEVKSKKHGALRIPVDAVRGLFRRH